MKTKQTRKEKKKRKQQEIINADDVTIRYWTLS